MWCNSQTLAARLKKSNRLSVRLKITDQVQKLVQDLIFFFWTLTMTNNISKFQFSMMKESLIKFLTQMDLQSSKTRISHSIQTQISKIICRWWIFLICLKPLMLEIKSIQHHQDCLWKESMHRNYLPLLQLKIGKVFFNTWKCSHFLLIWSIWKTQETLQFWHMPLIKTNQTASKFFLNTSRNTESILKMKICKTMKK